MSQENKERQAHQETVYEEWKKKYPLCFEGQGCCMSFGLEFNTGWNGIVEEMLGKTEAFLTKKYAEEGKPEFPFQIDQMKQKFGTLRIYVTGCYDEIFEFINEAEDRSHETCETCGNQAVLHCAKGGWWLHTFCPKCAEKYDYEPYAHKHNQV